MKIFKTIFTSLIIFSTCYSFSQGCSDAGFCTVGSMNHKNNTQLNEVAFGVTYGIADNDASVLMPSLEYNRKFGENFSINSKITYQSSTGNLGNSSGFSDMYLSGIYTMPLKEKSSLSFTGGIKIPLSKPDKLSDDNFFLPMDYQTSLGTFDLILGTSYQVKNWNFSAGFQLPLTNSVEWKNYYNFATIDFAPGNVPSSNVDYKRRADGLLKISRWWNIFNEKFTVQPSLLLINHFGNDEIFGVLGTSEIESSSGITLNGALDFGYKINDKSLLGITLASPFIVRDERPDGLTRSFVANVKYTIGF